ncbi:MAG: hypothetical protein SPL96_10920 [Bacteroidales bacterium]|nr:hypothetical protein [Bacteroidales bacterium]
MELKEFIKTAITDITDAVSELQSELKNGAIVSPSLPHAISNGTVLNPENDKVNRPISKIDFDVAITVGDSDSVEAGAKAGIQIFSAKLGSETKTHTENVSRMTFSIPLVLPTTHVKSREDLRDEKIQSRPKRRTSSM